MATFNPFTSSSTLDEFLLDIERNGQGEANPAMHDFLLQQQAAGVVPEFTDRLSTKKEEALDQFLIETLKEKVETEVGLNPEDWDVMSVTDSITAQKKLVELQTAIKKEGMRLEREKAEELGLQELQDRYLKLKAIPGATGFDAVRQQLASMEEQIDAQQQLVSSFINQDARGEIGGEVGPAFADLNSLAINWSNRVDELIQKEQRAQAVGDRDEKRQYAKDAKETEILTSIGGQESLEQYAKLLNKTESEALSMLKAGQVSPQIEKVVAFERANNRSIDIAEALTGPGMGLDAAKAVLNRGADANPVLQKEKKNIESMLNSTSSPSLINQAIADIKKERRFVAGNEPSSAESKIIAREAEYRAIEIAINSYKTDIKERVINPDMFTLDGVPTVPDAVQSASVVLVAQDPKAFVYPNINNINEVADRLLTLRESYEERRKANPEYVPAFDEVIQLMYKHMAKQINDAYEPIGFNIITPNDAYMSNIQMKMLVKNSARRVMTDLPVTPIKDPTDLNEVFAVLLKGLGG